MLDGLRNFASTWAGKVLGAFLLVGLAGFGISGVISGIGTNNVARVGDEDITVADFQRAYNAQLNSVAQQFGQMPTLEQAMALGIPSSVIVQLADNAALNSLGKDLGLGASEAKLAEFLRDDPTFASAIGTFDRQSFRRALEQIGMTETEYFNQQTEAVRRRQLYLSLFGSAEATDAAAELINRYGGDQRTIEYITVRSLAVPTPEAPNDAELQAYLEEHQSEYRTEATRSIRLMTLTPAALAESIEISDAEIAADYDSRQQLYTQPERRTIVQAVLPDDATVSMFETGQSAGLSFSNLVAGAGIEPTELGTLSEAEITDADLAEAAFSLNEGEFALIPGAQGQRAVTVTSIDPGGLQPLSEVEDDILARLALSEARDQYVDILDQIEEQRAAFTPLDQIASSFGLDLYEIDLTATGSELERVGSIPEDGRQRVASQVFAAEIDGLTPSIPLGANLSAWFDLLAITPEHDQTLDEVRAQVEGAWMVEQVDAAVAELVDSMVSRIESGEELTNVAIEISQFPEVSQPFTREGASGTAISATVANAVFGGGIGHVGAARNADGDTIVFRVTNIEPATGAPEKDMVDFLQNNVRDNLYGGFVTALRQDEGLRINQQVLNSLLGTSQ